jgi:putative tryptophan/tyrosine transport system substrate-binding protein
MKRREFIAGLGSAAAWPLAARAQQGDRVRRVGALMGFDESDLEAKAWLSGFARGLAELGWTVRNVRMDVRWPAGDVERMRVAAKEMVDLQPDVILASTTPVTAAVWRETRTIPIVFVTVGDPIGSGFVASLPRPGGNLTGFVNLEPSIAGKMLELLTEIAPGVKQAAFVFNPDNTPHGDGGSYFMTPFKAAARSLKVESIAAPVRSDTEIETVIAALGRTSGGGLVLSPDAFMFVHRATAISAAARHELVHVANSNSNVLVM